MQFQTLAPNESVRIGRLELEVLSVDAQRGEVRCGVSDPSGNPPYREVVLQVDPASGAVEAAAKQAVAAVGGPKPATHNRVGL